MPRKKQEPILVNNDSKYDVIYKLNAIVPPYRYKDFPWREMENLVKEIGPIVEVENKEGSDYEPSMHVVIKLVNHNIFLKAKGYYSSYGSNSFDENWEEVIPMEVTRTEYVPV